MSRSCAGKNLVDFRSTAISTSTTGTPHRHPRLLAPIPQRTAPRAPGACRPESARSVRDAFSWTEALVPVTCSAGQEYSASVTYRPTPRRKLTTGSTTASGLTCSPASRGAHPASEHRADRRRTVVFQKLSCHRSSEDSETPDCGSTVDVIRKQKRIGAAAHPALPRPVDLLTRWSSSHIRASLR